MIYGERVKWARERLNMDRMALAIALQTTQQNIANIENCKDGSRKLGWEKMLKLIAIADLPKGYFFYDDNEFQEIVLGDDNVIARGTVSAAELEKILEISKRLRHSDKP